MTIKNQGTVTEVGKVILIKFGLLMATCLMVAHYYFALANSLHNYRSWQAISALILLLIALLLPLVLKYPYLLWLKLSHVLGAINSRIILFVIFYGLIAPTALLRKIFGQQSFAKKHDLSADSYFKMALDTNNKNAKLIQTEIARNSMEKTY